MIEIFENDVVFEEDNYIWVMEDGHIKKYRKDEVKVKEPNWNRIKSAWALVIKVMHEELGYFNQEELNETPRRVTGVYKEWQKYATYGFKEGKWTIFDNGSKESGTELKYDQLVVLRGIRVFSKCSHHLETIDMKVDIAYLPGEKVIGLSKLARAARKFASKPSIQEQFTEELANFLFDLLGARFVMVVVHGIHYCIISRGARAEDAVMVTSAVRYDNNDELMKKNWKSLKEEALRLFEEAS